MYHHGVKRANVCVRLPRQQLKNARLNLRPDYQIQITLINSSNRRRRRTGRIRHRRGRERSQYRSSYRREEIVNLTVRRNSNRYDVVVEKVATFEINKPALGIVGNIMETSLLRKISGGIRRNGAYWI